ncbi:hypothetical protein [Namhaeicola litoreus]|uniref:Uncharacterized protein n=1 Tax=Namhaeicola litoreus TaxID=1052145 RepID=A0ABW3Y1S8_9FLAO
MKPLLFFFVCFLWQFSIAQHDVVIEKLIQKYAYQEKISCTIQVKVEVEGIRIPEKEVYVEFDKDKKIVVKGEGLALVPKKGTVNQIFDFFDSPFQSIFLGKEGDVLVYKLVSLDPKKDWITADIKFVEDDLQILESVVNTKEYGNFQTINQYMNEDLPSHSEITFEVKKFKVPLKFIGREQKWNNYPEKDEKIMGKITLRYTYL